MQRHRRSRPTVASRLDKAFGRTLRDMRLQHDFSQEKLAFDSGYHPTFISQLERGVKGPSLRTVIDLATTLQVPAALIVERVEAQLCKGRKP